jgi:hypothetical protein
MNYGDYDLGGKDLSWLVYGMQSWHSRTPFYLDHLGPTFKTNILGESPHLTFSDIYDRMTKHEHLGLAVTHIPYRYYFADDLNGVPGIFSYTDEFIINNLEDMSYNVPISGKRHLMFKYTM